MTIIKTTICIILATSTFSGCKKGEGPVGIPDTYTILQGHISGSLTALQSPYKVTADIIVDSLRTLNVGPDVRIFFQDSTQLFVRGRLVCAGSRFHPILLSSFDLFWKGIQIRNSPDTSLLQFTTLEYAQLSAANDYDRDGALEIVNASVTIRNSIFRYNKGNNGGAISLNQSQSLITNNVFYNNYGNSSTGAIVSSASSNRIINNAFYNNYGFNYGISLVIASPVFDQIQNNIFHRNSSRALDSGIFYYLADTSHYLSQFNYLQTSSSNPLFYSTTDFHLNVSSPCIDAGNPAPQFNDVDGTRNDQGAYGGPLGDW